MGKGKQFRPASAPIPADPEAIAVGSPYWLFGVHPVEAALRNPRRRPHRLLHTAEAAASHGALLQLAKARPQAAPRLEPVDRDALARLLPAGAVHQGLALLAEPLAPVDIYEVCDGLAEAEQVALLVLDQVTDPHNVGAILRSAAAFGARAVICTERHAAAETGVLAKAASGALDLVPLVAVTNLARAMETLKEAGVWCVGLAAEAEQAIAAANLTGKTAIVLGAEGSGLRRLTREHCDLLVRLPTEGPIAQLNVSNAAAVALYEQARQSARLPSQVQDR
ncbi:MAG TPA: 23S rRNA (guanosine(2251)-2'-O)-methyltransferase RlmB [Candidatus Angelobacter sp.]|nr:23S rRNA (guanosine(2251)-2'-O)-methyltransferase RlmB [Candidatus Angelobacter sp.]